MSISAACAILYPEGNLMSQKMLGCRRLPAVFCCILFISTVSVPVKAQEEKASEQSEEQSTEQQPEKSPPEIRVLTFDDGRDSLTTRQASFYLGKNLAYIVALKARGVPDEEMKSASEAIKGISGALEIQLPELPEISGFEHLWTAYEVLLTQDKSIREILEKKHGKECAHLFSLAAHMLLAPSLYDNDFSEASKTDTQKAVNEMILDKLALSSSRANFKHEQASVDALGPYYRWMHNEKPTGSEMSKLMLAAFRELESLLKKELVEQEMLDAIRKARGKK